MNFAITIAIVILALVAIFGVVVFIFMIKKSPSTEQAKIPKNYSLDELIKIVASERNQDKLKEIIDLYLATQPFEAKSKSLSPSMAKKLDFITAAATNPTINAKLIVYLNKELKSKYSAYKSDIETYEKIGLAKRKMRS